MFCDVIVCCISAVSIIYPFVAFTWVIIYVPTGISDKTILPSPLLIILVSSPSLLNVYLPSEFLVNFISFLLESVILNV